LTQGIPLRSEATAFKLGRNGIAVLPKTPADYAKKAMPFQRLLRTITPRSQDSGQKAFFGFFKTAVFALTYLKLKLIKNTHFTAFLNRKCENNPPP